MSIITYSTSAVNIDELSKNTSPEDELGERSGLWGDDHSRSSRSGDFHFTESDSTSRGQYDLHQHHGQGGNEAEEATLGFRLLAAVRGVVDWLPSPRRPPLQSIQPVLSASASVPSIFDDPTVSRENENLTPYELNILDDSADIAMYPAPPSPFSISSSSAGVRSGRSSVANARRNRHRSSPFCPCFSPTVSDDSDGDVDSLPAQPAPPLSTNQWAVSDQISGDVPIHRIVEYSHHFVPDVDRIYAASYYWGVMDRFKAEELLEGKKEGTFLLRDSAQSEYLFSVSFRRYKRTLHARIEQNGGRFGFDIYDTSVFSANSVTALIENYKDPTRCLFFEPKLLHPLHRNTVFSLQELSRAAIASNTSYSSVAHLRLPPKLKQYVREYHYSIPVRTAINVQD